MSTITWYGHSAFKIESGPVKIFIDPFFAPCTGLTYKDAGDVNLVLISHDHGDHVGDAVALCRHTGAMLGTVVGTAAEMIKRGIPEKQILNGIGFNIGGTLEYMKARITMTQAFHSSDSSVPVGYILHMPDGLKIYHAGDTGIFSSMKLLGDIYGIDLALLPIGGVFTMDALQAANACRLLGCGKVIPMHWGTFPVLAQSPDDFISLLARVCPDCKGMAMKAGESMEIRPE